MKIIATIAFSIITLVMAVSSFAAEISTTDYVINTGFVVSPESSSPSWNGHLDNFNDANNSTSDYVSDGTAGNPLLDPSAFEVASGTVSPGQVSPGQVTTSSFNSWNGQASPSGAFSGEFGSRIHHFFILEGKNGNQYSLDQISYIWTSDDGVLNLSGDFSSVNYSTAYVGIDYGGDGVLGGGDDTYSTSATGSDPFDAISGIGPGNGYSAYGSGTNQDQLNNVVSYVDGLPGSTNNVVAEYTFFGTQTVSDSIAITTVPEPSATSLLLGFMGLFLASRRRYKK